jgi:hypothetical protein
MTRPFPWKVLLLSLPPLAFWVFYLDRFVVQNLPQMDDLAYTIEFIRPFEAASSLREKLGVLFIQHFVTEHRVPLPKLIIYTQYLLTGEIDFAVMAWYGNLIAVPGLLLLCWRTIQRAGWSAWTFLPLPYLFFQIQYYELFTWSNCSLLYIFTTFLAWTSLYFAAFSDGKRGRFTLSLLFSVLCLLNFGNGMFVYLPLLAILLYQNRYRAALLTGAVAAVGIGLYFIGYESGYKSAVQPTVVLSTLTLFGAYLEPFWQWQNGLIFVLWLLGLTVLVVFFLALLRLVRGWTLPTGRPVLGSFGSLPSASPARLFLTAGLLFLLMTGVAVAIKRSGVSANEMFVSRYRYISLFSLGTAYLLAVGGLRASRQRLAGQVLAAGALLVLVVSYLRAHVHILNNQEVYAVSAYNYQHHRNWAMYLPSSEWYAMVNDGTDRLVVSGAYQFPASFFSDWNPTQTDITHSPVPLRLETSGGLVSVFNDEFQPTQRSTATSGTCLVLESATKTYLVPIQRLPNRGRKDVLRTGRLVGKGFTARIQRGVYPAGRYQLSLLHREGVRIQQFPTGLTVDL